MTTLRFTLIIFSLLVFGCSQSHEEIIKPAEKTKDNAMPPLPCSRILITLYDSSIPLSSGLEHYGPFSTNIIYEADNRIEIVNFNKMLEQSEKTGYCCCPDQNYTIAFYDKTNNYKSFYVDTVEFKDRVRIYETSFQFSYLVNKSKWCEFLRSQKEITYNKYFIIDLHIARKVYEYSLSNDLPIITSNRVSKHWMSYDGDFTFKVAAVGEILEIDKVFQDMRKRYPDDKFSIETISHYQMCGSYGGKDCHEEYILRISCNQAFYKKFDLYSPKSFYNKAIAEFLILGEREELNKLDNIAPRE